MKSGTGAAGIATAALAGLLFGFDTAVIAGVIADVRDLFQLSPAAVGVSVSSALWGTLAGALLAGVPGDRYGSRNGLRIMATLYIVSAAGSALAWNWESLVAFRFIAGLAIGGSSVLAPVYISEMAPPARRGALVGLFQLNIVAGILVAYLSNYLIGGAQLGTMEWRVKLGITTLPAVVFFALLFRVPQSPLWLAAKDRVTVEKLSWHAHRKPILLAITLAVFNQLAGINAILYYLNDIFAAAGYSKMSGHLQAVFIGATNLLFTVLALLVIDRIGRRRLLLIGSVGMAICLAFVALVMNGQQPESRLIYVLVGFIAFFAFSQGAVIWVYISEIFPTSVRSRGQSLGSSTHWLLNALISIGFPIVAAWSKPAPFAFFAVMMVLQFFVVLTFFPETRGAVLKDE